MSQESSKELVQELISTMNAQLEQRERIARKQQQRVAAINRARHHDAQKAVETEAAKNKRNKHWNILTGIGATVLGVIMMAFILSIWKDMNVMRESMQDMRVYMQSMSGDMGSMKTDMHAMNTSMGSMKDDFSVVRVVMTDMQENMTPSVVRMSQDVARMSHNVQGMHWGVTRMASDTDAMSEPFRAMNDFIPW